MQDGAVPQQCALEEDRARLVVSRAERSRKRGFAVLLLLLLVLTGLWFTCKLLTSAVRKLARLCYKLVGARSQGAKPEVRNGSQNATPSQEPSGKGKGRVKNTVNTKQKSE